MSEIRIRPVLKQAVLELLTEFRDGMPLEAVYRHVGQACRMPPEWHLPRSRSHNHAPPAPPECQGCWEPTWQNDVRHLRRDLIDAGLFREDPARGWWQLSEAGLQVGNAGRGRVELTADERAVLTPPTLLSEEPTGEFTPEYVLRQIRARRGQRAFRAALLLAYDGRCALSGCDAISALEAAHLRPASEQGSDQTTNGLPLPAQGGFAYSL